MKNGASMILVMALLGALPLLGCGHQLGMRHFAGPIEPEANQGSTNSEIGDDRSVTYSQGRLEVNLRPLTDEILNRQLAAYAPDKSGFYLNPYELNLNPYTYGDYIPPEQDWGTSRFTVFRLRVKNYEYPKVLVNPEEVYLVASNGRRYKALTIAAMVEYYWPYAVGYAGNSYLKFEERKDILQVSLYKKDAAVFSGQESEGYIVFPPLHKDVSDFDVIIEDVGVRFDFRDEPVETVDIPYRFSRDVYVAKEPKPVTQ